MPAQIAAISGVLAVGAHHHDHGVPAHIGADAAFELQIAWAEGFVLRLYGVDIGRGGRERQVDAVLARLFQQLFNQKMAALFAVNLDNGFEGV